MIAKEIFYHRTCYMKYTHKKSLDGISEAKVYEESRGKKGTGYARAFSKLASEVQNTILDNPAEGKFVSMRDLCAQYVLLLNEEGLPDLQSYRINHL